MKPGIYTDLEIEAYHAAAGVSSSALGHILRSVEHYEAYKTEPRTRSTSMAFGSAVHMAFLEPELFQSRYIDAKPPHSLDWRRDEAAKLAAKGLHPEEMTEGKLTRTKPETIATYLEEPEVAEMVAHYREHGETPALDEETIKAVLRARDNLDAHPIARNLVLGSTKEVSYFWQDEETGLLCKCRPDIEREDDVWVDLKTTRDASEKAFAKSVHNFGYYRQGAFYADGSAIATGTPKTLYVIIAVENTAPYSVAVYELDHEWIDHGRERYREALRRLAARKDGAWKGYPLEITKLYKPAWA
jgi:hypothetical protein